MRIVVIRLTPQWLSRSEASVSGLGREIIWAVSRVHGKGDHLGRIMGARDVLPESWQSWARHAAGGKWESRLQRREPQRKYHRGRGACHGGSRPGWQEFWHSTVGRVDRGGWGSVIEILPWTSASSARGRGGNAVVVGKRVARRTYRQIRPDDRKR